MKSKSVTWSFCRSHFVASYLAYIQHMRGRRATLQLQDERSKVKVNSFFHFFTVRLCPYFTTSFHMRYTHNLWGPNVWGQFPSQKVIGQGHTGHVKLLLCPLRGFLLIWPNHFICGIHAPYKGVKCRAPFSGRMVNVQSHMACFKFWPCPLCGPVLILLTHFICCMKGQWSRSYRLFEIFTLSITWLPLYLTKSHCIRHTYNTWGGDVSCTIFVICPPCGSMPNCPLAAERCRSYYIPRITYSVYNREIAFVHCFVALSIIGDRPYRLWKFCPILTSSYITEYYSGRYHI